jgi:uncharacterized membrane protein
MREERNICSKIRNLLVIVTIIGGFICWFFIPEITAIHYDITFTPKAYGSKNFLLLLLILPLFSLIPLGSSEYHVESEENNEKLNKQVKANAVIQLILAIVLSAYVWISLLLSLVTVP